LSGRFISASRSVLSRQSGRRDRKDNNGTDPDSNQHPVNSDVVLHFSVGESGAQLRMPAQQAISVAAMHSLRHVQPEQ